MFLKFHQIWHVAAVINAKQCVKTNHFTWHVYTHYLVMLRETELWPDTVSSRSFQHLSEITFGNSLPTFSNWHCWYNVRNIRDRLTDARDCGTYRHAGAVQQWRRHLSDSVCLSKWWTLRTFTEKNENKWCD